MGKLIIILSLLTFSSCYQEIKKEPIKFHKSDEVYFEVPEFYRNVCSSKGTVESFNFTLYNWNGSRRYTIDSRALNNNDYCEFEIEENQMTLVK